MRQDMRQKIIAYNKAQAKRAEKASDMDILIAALAKLPPGQLKKVLSDDVCAVLRKYGIDTED